MRRTVPTLLLAGLVGGLLGPPAQAASAPQTVTTGRQIPWGIAFLPDGTTMVTERNTGRIYELRPGRPVRHIYTVTEARPAGEAGLLGIAVGPDYARNPRLFVYYTSATDNRIAVIRRGSPARPVPIVTGIPRATVHDGGRLAFGPDGYLYAGTGDAGVSSRAQDTTSLGGKILRVTTTGAPAPGNRYGRVFSYGHRNVQGLVFDRAGRLWATEFGQNTYDEVNLIVGGGNYGWPVVEGRGGDPRFVEPKWTWSPSEASPSGLGIKGDSLYVAALRGERIWRLRLSGSSITGATPLLQGRYGRLRAVSQNPRDGTMWVLTSNTGKPTFRPGDDRVLRFSRFP